MTVDLPAPVRAVFDATKGTDAFLDAFTPTAWWTTGDRVSRMTIRA